ncbi:hypothetical protein [Solimonas marina]|uniref:Uncharacterized protein n=1 Tax=Solimonas marina TaxID=2714601 RepID=A0A969W6M7_9GAMM|nr:hypothetical protein [Solimonas marina]NKF21557.1 hypothetical protein [Solimonas marina]
MRAGSLGNPAVGRRNGAAKLTEDAVVAMRAEWKPKGRGRRRHEGPGIKDLAAKYGVSFYAAWSALHGYTWGHVP